MTRNQYDIEEIIRGYAQGYFLMANEPGAGLAWYSSRERALIPLDDPWIPTCRQCCSAIL
ncbi:hypothetical protein [Leptolyngbya sp. 7M]|uniref:hypothetical protein n=1 Tax=Leptolyngbya sp. 7M TaxID=2812896 RepID=UPI001B8B0B5F|nr:hypothetical protein [Leptolyngbya sp. 7M]QYO62469.1 hypothetical protein JVX88_20590 [Leptolyngbya sp. 7M]